MELCSLKTCSKCGKEKSLNEFYFRKDVNDYRTDCKSCRGNHDKLYYFKNREQKIKEAKIYRDSHKEKTLKYKRVYYLNNKKEIIIKHNEYQKQRRLNNINFRIVSVLRTQLGQALKNNLKAGHTLDLLGCSIEFLKKHLESQFKDGMNWDNRGNNGWHIDHIRPCCTFNLSDPKQQEQCFHYTNLQPLWKLDNLKKSKKYAF